VLKIKLQELADQMSILATSETTARNELARLKEKVYLMHRCCCLATLIEFRAEQCITAAVIWFVFTGCDTVQRRRFCSQRCLIG